jgi:hypothetical protein
MVAQLGRRRAAQKSFFVLQGSSKAATPRRAFKFPDRAYADSISLGRTLQGGVECNGLIV